MICTCDNCHYTFECPELPTRCPDCGKETRSHKVGSRIVSLACVREATEAEIDCYKRIQRELAEEESQATAAAALADKLMELGDPFSFEDDPYDMPVHEHNFALMLVYYTHTMGFYGKRDLNRRYSQVSRASFNSDLILLPRILHAVSLPLDVDSWHTPKQLTLLRVPAL